jgi:hypothetical protein
LLRSLAESVGEAEESITPKLFVLLNQSCKSTRLWGRLIVVALSQAVPINLSAYLALHTCCDLYSIITTRYLDASGDTEPEPEFKAEEGGQARRLSGKLERRRDHPGRTKDTGVWLCFRNFRGDPLATAAPNRSPHRYSQQRAAFIQSFTHQSYFNLDIRARCLVDSGTDKPCVH